MNPLTDPWIKCVFSDGTTRAVSPKEALRLSKEIIGVAESPRDDFSILRFLLVTEQLDDQDFNLFDEKHPFLQVVKEDHGETVGKLFEEIPTGNNVTYTRGVKHSYDGEYGVFGKCCLKGLVRLSAWAAIGGRGYTGSVNGSSPPVYAYPVGRNLSETMSLNRQAKSFRDPPSWDGESIGNIGFMEAYTWQPRQVHLKPTAGGTCHLCGTESETLVYECHFSQGRNPPEKGRWNDPNVLPLVRIDNSGKKPKVVRTTVKNPVEYPDMTHEKFVETVVTSVRQLLDSEEVNSLNCVAPDRFQLRVVTSAMKQAKLFKEFSTSLFVDRDSGEISEIKPSVVSPEITTDPERKRNFLPFLSDLTGLTPRQLAVVRDRNLTDDQEAMEIFATTWRRHRTNLSGKTIPLMVVKLYADHPKTGLREINVSEWKEVASGSGFFHRLSTEVSQCRREAVGVNWDCLMRQLYRKI